MSEPIALAELVPFWVGVFGAVSAFFAIAYGLCAIGFTITLFSDEHRNWGEWMDSLSKCYVNAMGTFLALYYFGYFN